jgi:copper chaperone CopZ
VQSALSKVPGVISTKVTMPDKAEVKIDKTKVKVELLLAAVKAAGNYSATVKK